VEEQTPSAGRVAIKLSARVASVQAGVDLRGVWFFNVFDFCLMV
jgi:hypothetical protein